MDYVRAMGRRSFDDIIDESQNGNGRFTLDTNIMGFTQEVSKEIEISHRLKRLLLYGGHTKWRRSGKFNTIRDLILSYRRGIVAWSPKSRRELTNILTTYGFQEIAPSRYARSF